MFSDAVVETWKCKQYSWILDANYDIYADPAGFQLSVKNLTNSNGNFLCHFFLRDDVQTWSVGLIWEEAVESPRDRCKNFR